MAQRIKTAKATTIKKILSILVLGLIFLWLIKDGLIKSSAETIGSKMLGARLSIQKLSLGVFSQKIHIQNLVIGNPPGFPDEHLLLMPEITVQCRVMDALKGEYRFPLVVINLKEMILVRNKDGKLNIDELKIVQENLHKKKEEPAPAPPPDAPAPSQPPAPSAADIELSIDTLKLNVERVIYKDYSKGEPPVIQVYEINLKNKTITGIDNLYELVTRVLVEAVKPTAIRKAGMFAATSLLGAGFLPGAALGIIVAKDDASATFPVASQKARDVVLKMISELGTLKKTDDSRNMIYAKIYDCDIIFEIKEEDKRSTVITVKARKFFLAKPNIASGLIYQLTDRLK